MSLALETDRLCRQFGRTRVLDDLTLTVEPGSVYALVGANGAGKTTTVKVLMNIMPPTSGHASVFGTDSRQLGPRDFQAIGYVSENQEMPDWMTVEAFMAYLRPFYPRWDDARARALLSAFHLPADRKLKHLSRGMRMKAALASSLAYHPKLLVLDEPFTGLDPLVRDEVVEGLVECADETTMLISSHDLAEIESFATHVGFLDRGRLQFSEEMTTLSQRFREVEVTLGTRAALPQAWPSSWLRPEATSHLVRFVHPDFDAERVIREVRQLFGGDAHVDARPMSLRSIFVALARESRTAA